MGDPTGETDKGALRLDFDRRLLLQFRGSTITSDAGLLRYRELDDALGLTDAGAEVLADARTGKNARHRLAGLLRQSVFGRLAGYEDVNDAGRLCCDPAMRWVVGGGAITGSAASASQMGRFETKWLSRPDNLAALADLPGQWIDQVHQRRPPKMIVLDMDSSESPTYGEQEGTAYNGHFGCSCYHPLFVFNQLGDVERCGLRPGNVHSADGWLGVLEPVISRYRGIAKRLYFRGDAAFANPAIYEFLETEGIGYTIPLPSPVEAKGLHSGTDGSRTPRWRKAGSNSWSLCAEAFPAEEKRLVCTSRGSSQLDLHDPRGRPIAELADRHQRPGVSLNSFAPGGVGTSKTLSVTETNE
jgi:Transposase DDE domain group 1